MKAKQARPVSPRVVTREPGALRRKLWRMFKIVCAVVVLAALSLVAVDFHAWVTQSEQFAIRNIEIEGASPVRTAEVGRSLHHVLGENFWSLSSRRLHEIVDAHPWVAWARVERVLPDTIRIEVRERRPVARALDALGDSLAADEDGWLFTLPNEVGPTSYDIYPILRGVTPELVFRGAHIDEPDVLKPLRVAGRLRELAPEVWQELDGLACAPYGDLVLFTRGPLGNVFLSLYPAGVPVERLRTVRQALIEHGIACARVDLRSDRGAIAMVPLPDTGQAGKPAGTPGATPEGFGWSQANARPPLPLQWQPLLAHAQDGDAAMNIEGGERR